MKKHRAASHSVRLLSLTRTSFQRSAD